MGDEGALTTAGGNKIPALHIAPGLFIDRTIAIFGPSKTGKTVITKHVMKVLNDHIEQVLIISPTEPSNRTYEGIVDPALIHYRMYLADPANPKRDDGARGALRFLEALWKRQEMMAAIYTRANNPEVLSQLFAKLPKAVHAEGLRHIETIDAKRRQVGERVRRGAEEGKRDEKLKEVNEKFKKMQSLIYKKYITPEYETLWARDDLSENERYSLVYLNFNPRLLLIFDDCAAQLKPFFNKEIFRLLFYQNRHSFITVIVCCQDDTDLPTNIRKNAFVSFFTEPIVCLSNFERASNKFSKPTKAYVNEIIGDVFVGHRKLAYIREDDRGAHFYHVSCPYPKPFRFGSAASHELCESIQSVGVSMDTDNPFYDRFKI